MKKYILLACLPLLSQETLHTKDPYADLDAIILNELRAAQKTIHSSAKLELEPILHALVYFGKKSNNNRQIAIDNLVRIQKALQECKAQQYKTSWDTICSYFSSNPKIVTQQIDPALAKVNKALADLKVTQSEYTLAATIIIGSIITIAAIDAIIGTSYIFREQKQPLHTSDQPDSQETTSDTVLNDSYVNPLQTSQNPQQDQNASTPPPPPTPPAQDEVDEQEPVAFIPLSGAPTHVLSTHARVSPQPIYRQSADTDARTSSEYQGFYGSIPGQMIMSDTPQAVRTPLPNNFALW